LRTEWESHRRNASKRATQRKGKKEENQLIQDWEAICKQEETPRQQKSTIRWLKEGERNTKFFHRKTIARRSHNKILNIQDQDGIERESHKTIKTH